MCRDESQVNQSQGKNSRVARCVSLPSGTLSLLLVISRTLHLITFFAKVMFYRKFKTIARLAITMAALLQQPQTPFAFEFCQNTSRDTSAFSISSYCPVKLHVITCRINYKLHQLTLPKMINKSIAILYTDCATSIQTCKCYDRSIGPLTNLLIFKQQ